MSSTLRLLLGVSVLATAVACDNAGADGTGSGPMAMVGSAGSPGAGTGSGPAGTGTSAVAGTGSGTARTAGAASSAAGAGGGGSLPEGVPLTAADGWVDAMSNTLGIQGAMFAYADATSGMGLVEDFAGPNACIKGTAAKVDLKCTPMAPAKDCYGQFWGAAIGLNLNQPTVMMGGLAVGGDAMPFDASALKGFAFEITGTKVPVSLRFKAENASGEFCSPPAKPVKLGANTFLFSDLMTQCWKTGGTSAEGAKSAIVKIAWQVVTNDKSAVPFDYCVANLRALE